MNNNTRKQDYDIQIHRIYANTSRAKINQTKNKALGRSAPSRGNPGSLGDHPESLGDPRDPRVSAGTPGAPGGSQETPGDKILPIRLVLKGSWRFLRAPVKVCRPWWPAVLDRCAPMAGWAI